MVIHYTKYTVKGLGENKNKRQLVFKVVKDCLEKKKPSFDELNSVFKAEIQDTKGFFAKYFKVKDFKHFSMRLKLIIVTLFFLNIHVFSQNTTPKVTNIDVAYLSSKTIPKRTSNSNKFSYTSSLADEPTLQLLSKTWNRLFEGKPISKITKSKIYLHDVKENLFNPPLDHKRFVKLQKSSPNCYFLNYVEIEEVGNGFLMSKSCAVTSNLYFLPKSDLIFISNIIDKENREQDSLDFIRMIGIIETNRIMMDYDKVETRKEALEVKRKNDIIRQADSSDFVNMLGLTDAQNIMKDYQIEKTRILVDEIVRKKKEALEVKRKNDIIRQADSSDFVNMLGLTDAQNIMKDYQIEKTRILVDEIVRKKKEEKRREYKIYLKTLDDVKKFQITPKAFIKKYSVDSFEVILPYLTKAINEKLINSYNNISKPKYLMSLKNVKYLGYNSRYNANSYPNIKSAFSFYIDSSDSTYSKQNALTGKKIFASFNEGDRIDSLETIPASVSAVIPKLKYKKSGGTAPAFDAIEYSVEWGNINLTISLADIFCINKLKSLKQEDLIDDNLLAKANSVNNKRTQLIQSVSDFYYGDDAQFEHEFKYDNSIEIKNRKGFSDKGTPSGFIEICTDCVCSFDKSQLITMAIDYIQYKLKWEDNADKITKDYDKQQELEAKKTKDKLISKYGKKYVDAAYNAQFINGMHIDLASVIVDKFFEVTYQNASGNSKIFHVKGKIDPNLHKKLVFTNNKLTSISTW